VIRDGYQRRNCVVEIRREIGNEISSNKSKKESWRAQSASTH